MPVHLPEYIQKNFNKYKYVLIVCLIGLLLTALPTGQSVKKSENTAETSVFPQTQSLEQTLEETLAHINGVGRVEVLLSVESGYKAVYAYDLDVREDIRTDSGGSEQSSEKLQTMVFSGGSAQQPVIVRTDGPQYRGAVIVCDGADSASIRLEITEAVKAITGITSDCIAISKMKQ